MDFVNPIHMRFVCFRRAANRQSSIIADLIFVRPPAFSRSSQLTSMQPPAAAALDFFLSFTKENGYSFWKKKMKAGIKSLSHTELQCSLTMRDTRARFSLSAFVVISLRFFGWWRMSESENK